MQRKLAGLIFALTLTGIAPGAGAAEPARLDEVVVTAQKREERQLDVPASLAVVDGEDVDHSAPAGLTDVLNTVPGVAASVGYQGGTTLITLRGVGAAGPLLSGPSPVAYYLDGAPFGFVTSAIAPDMAAYDLQRIEVLRGPQGTLYGASAQSGVVRVLTHDADLDRFGFKTRVSTSVTQGGDWNHGADAAINVPVIEGRLAVRGVIGYFAPDGWVDAPTGSNINDAKLRTYRLKVNAQPAERLAIGLSAWRSRNDFGAPSASDDDGQVSATLAQPISADYGVYGLNLDYSLPGAILASRTSYLDYANAGTWDLTAAGIAGVPFFTNLDSRVKAQELLAHSPPGSAWRWTTGAAFRDGQDGLGQSSLVLPAAVDYTFRSRSVAVFATAGRRFLDDQFEWSLGLRYFHDRVLNRENVQGQGLPDVPLYHAQRTFDSTTPRAVLSWFPGEDMTVYASYSEGFRSGFPQNAAVMQIEPGFPAVQPDKLRNYEVGAKISVSPRLVLDGALYCIRWSRIQQSTVVQSGGIPFVAIVNGTAASGAGVDIGLTARPVDGLQLELAASWNGLSLDGPVDIPAGRLFEEGDRLNYSPALTGAAKASWDFPVGAAGFHGLFTASAHYSSHQDYRGTNTGITVLHGDALLVARTSVSLLSPAHWSVTLFAENLANEHGATPTVNIMPEWQLRIRPRTVGLQFDYEP